MILSFTIATEPLSEKNTAFGTEKQALAEWSHGEYKSRDIAD